MITSTWYSEHNKNTWSEKTVFGKDLVRRREEESIFRGVMKLFLIIYQ
jgi:hypothetical protein